jgi:mono/diheme cytochrome c family protein/uncharacterized membrane protein
MSSASHDLVLFLGRFHPGLVHLPIGGLVLLGIMELLARFSRFKDAAQSRRLILGFVAVTALTAALCGWLLSNADGYEPQLLQWHQWTGFAFAAGCTVAFLLSWLGLLQAYRLALLATFAVLLIASHLGASITHGRDFLTRYAPAPLRALLSGKAAVAAAPTSTRDLRQRRVFAEVIQPILLQRCSACHGPEKQKAELRMDSLSALLKGGKSGPALVKGNAHESHLIQRLLLPANDEDHMPPEGKPQPTLAEIVALQWWIDSGAPADGQPAGAAHP